MADVSGASRLSVELNGVPPVVAMPEDRKLKGGDTKASVGALLTIALTVTYLVFSFVIPVGMLERTREMTGTGSLDEVVANCNPENGRRLSGTASFESSTAMMDTAVVTDLSPPPSPVVAPVPFFAGPGPKEESVINALGKLEIANILYITNNVLFGLPLVALCIIVLSLVTESAALAGCATGVGTLAACGGGCGGCVSLASFVLTIMVTIAVNDVDIECPSNAYADMDGMVGMCWLVYFFPVIFCCCVVPIIAVTNGAALAMMKPGSGGSQNFGKFGS